MGSNVVVFGKRDAGKTTLIGYLYARTLTADRLQRTLYKKRARLGAIYDEKERYSYLISSKDEIRSRLKPNDGGDVGNTKRLHFTAWGQDYVIIDTPGFENTDKLTTQRDKGIFMGDIGIYVVEVKELLENTTNFSLMSHVFLWHTLHPNKIIIALSQSDTKSLEDVKEAYEKAKKIFNEYANLNAFIIPISINRDVDIASDMSIPSDANIFTKDPNMSFFDGSTLTDSLRMLTEDANTQYDEKKSDFCIYADKYFDHMPKQGAGSGRTWRNKVLFGEIEKGVGIKMLPIKYQREYTIAIGKIKNIRLLNNKDCNAANVGEIVGLDISGIRVNEVPVEKTDVASTTGTIFVNDNCKVFWGNIIRFHLNAIELNKYRARNSYTDKKSNYKPFRSQENIGIYWFGRVIEVKVISQYEKDDRFFIIAYIQHTYVAMPNIEKDFFIRRMPIVLRHTEDDKEKKYINVCLDKLGVFGSAYMICEQDEISDVFQTINNNLIGKNIDLIVEDNRIITKMKQSDDVARMLKDIECAIDENAIPELDIKIRIETMIV